MKVGIIDDEKPARGELSYLIKALEPDSEIIEIESGEEALEKISNESFDLLCIDINLGDISGTTLASTARKLLPNVEIVFATAYNTYAEKAFEVDALYYLLKPFSEDKVRRMLDKYKNKHNKEYRVENAEEYEDSSIKLTKIPLKVDKKIIFLDISLIVYIEVQNRTCIIHTKNKDFIDTAKLKDYEDTLKDYGFFRIHKSYLINLNYIKEIYPWFNNSYCVRMEGFEDIILPLSRNKIKELKTLLTNS